MHFQIPIEHLKNRAGSPQSLQASTSSPSKTPTSAQEILELMRNLQNVNKTSVDQNLREEVANLEGMVLSFETYLTVERQIFFVGHRQSGEVWMKKEPKIDQVKTEIVDDLPEEIDGNWQITI